MQGQENIRGQRARSVDLILNRLPSLGSRSLDVSVLLALVFFVANILQYWNNWAVDLSAYYYAGYFYDTGQLDQIYAGPPQIIGPEMPAPWVAAVAQSGHSGEQTYPFIYLPWIASLMAPIARNFSPMQVMNGAAVLNAALMTASIVLAWRIMAPKRVELWLWTLISVSVLSTSGAAVLAVAAGGIVFLLAWFAPRRMPVLLAALISAYMVSSPLISGTLAGRDTVMRYENDLARSTYHRLLVWKFIDQRTAEHPVLGWGFESSRAIPGGEAQLVTHDVAMPLHLHNGIMQIWLELGLPGGLLTALLLVWIMLVVRRGGVDDRDVASGGSRDGV